jgi:uncharacterized protein
MTLVLITLAILFVAALVKTTLGFGESLLAMPLLTLTLGLTTATPVVGLLGLILTLLMVGRHWRQVDLRATGALLAAALVGMPFGILLVRWVPQPVGTRLLGGVLIGFGAFSLYHPRWESQAHRGWAYLLGFLAGLLGSAYNTSGPPMVVYGALRGWPPAQFRATMQSFFLPVSVLVVGAHAFSGLWTLRVLGIVLLATPLLVPALWLGIRLQRRIPVAQFSKLIYATLMLLGLVLLK